MANECDFKNIHLENLGYCPNVETVGGTKTNIAYIPMAQLKTFKKPTVDNDTGFGNRLTIDSEGLEPEEDKGFKQIIMMIDETELKNVLVGNKGNKKPQASLEALIPNFTAANLGFVDAHKNTPMCFVVPDSTGQLWVMPDSYFDTAEATTGKTYEDNSGIIINITANSKLYLYEGDIEILPDEED